MITLEGQYYDGLGPIGSPAKMDIVGSEVTITSGQTSEKFPALELSVSPRIGRSNRFIALPNGTQFMCADHSYLDSLGQEGKTEGLAAWLEARWGVALTAVVISVGIMLAGYFYALPVAAEHLASRIPIETEQRLGQQTLILMDKNKFLEPSKLDSNEQKIIRDSFYRLQTDLPMKNYYQLEFRDSFIGPNAFTLPGGIIVITDGMVKFAQSYEEIMAVLAHEIGHVELHHTMRSILQNSVVAVAAGTITSDASSLSLIVSGLPALVVQTKYSREFETEADDYAFGLLQRKGYSPAAFASIMERLAKNNQNPGFSFLSTHPLTAERVKRARAAAQN